MNGQLDGKVPACSDAKAEALLREHKDLGTTLGVRGPPPSGSTASMWQGRTSPPSRASWAGRRDTTKNLRRGHDE